MKFNKDTTIVGIFIAYILFIIGFCLMQFANTLKLQGKENPILQTAGQTIAIISFVLIFIMLMLEIVMIKFYELEKGRYNTILSKLPIDEKKSILTMFQIYPDSEILLEEKDLDENSLAFSKILESERDNKEMTVTLVDIYKTVTESISILKKDDKLIPFTYYVPIVNSIRLGVDESNEKAEESTEIRSLIIICPSKFNETFKFKPLKIWDREVQSDITLRSSMVSLQLIKRLTPHSALCLVVTEKEVVLNPTELTNTMISALAHFNSLLQRSSESVGKELVNQENEIERRKNEYDLLECAKLEDVIDRGLVDKRIDASNKSSNYYGLFISLAFIIGVIIGVVIP